MSVPSPVELAGLAAAGFLASAHCVGMCGPYLALCLAAPAFGGRPSAGAFALFSLSRLVVYSGLGALSGGLGQAVSRQAAGASSALAIAMGAVASVMGLSLLGLVRDPASLLATAGGGRWLGRAMEAFRRATSGLPPGGRRPALVTLLGGLQGLLPCGVVYAFLARAAASGNPGSGALTMAAFGLGTVPALAVLAFAARRLPAALRDVLWRLAGLLVTGGGLFLVLRGLAGLGLVPHGALW